MTAHKFYNMVIFMGLHKNSFDKGPLLLHHLRFLMRCMSILHIKRILLENISCETSPIFKRVIPPEKQL